MNHREIQDRLDAYLDGELPADERRTIEDHLSGCVNCAVSLDAQRRISRAVFRQPPIPNTEFFVARVMARIHEAAAEPAGIFSGFWKWPALALAAMTAVLITTTPRLSSPVVDQISTRNVLLADSSGHLMSVSGSPAEPVAALLDVTEEI